MNFYKYIYIFSYFIYLYIHKCQKIYQLNIIKKIKKTTKKARERYQDLSKEEKWKKQQYHCECYKNLSENEKKKLVDLEKKYYRMTKNALL